MKARPRTAWIVVAALSALALLLAGCAAAAAPPLERSSRTAIPLPGCGTVACAGTLAGAAYEIRLPKSWNGTLLIYSHGYRFAEPVPPDFTPVDSSASAAPTADVAQGLLDRGFALIGSSYSANGWAVPEGVSAGEQLYALFRTSVAVPDRVYLWGDSLGGLITQTLAARHPDWVSGVAPLCGALGGTNANLDLALDVAYAVKTLIYPQLKLTGFTSNDEAVSQWQAAYAAITRAGADLGRGVPKIVLIAALVDAPAQTGTYDGVSITSQIKAYAESILTALGYGTYGRYEIERRVGGNPSTNSEVDYAQRVSPAERQLIDGIARGAADANLAALAAGERVTADEAARTKADALGNPTGTVRDPTITLHTRADPLVLAQNESLFADRKETSGGSTADLVQLFTAPPKTYSETAGAPYGAGHCNFTTAERLAVITLLDNWVRRGEYPAPGAVAAAFGQDSGLLPVYAAGPWPTAAP
jgi:pimeloyl-ACP methyl ester carboxylesterase